MAEVKITVVKTMNTLDIFGDNPPGKINRKMLASECQRFVVGQEFILNTDPNAPASQKWQSLPAVFELFAYAEIQRDIMHILFGGSYPWMEEEGVVISCCTDGLRPVVFRIERISN